MGTCGGVDWQAVWWRKLTEFTNAHRESDYSGCSSNYAASETERQGSPPALGIESGGRGGREGIGVEKQGFSLQVVRE